MTLQQLAGEAGTSASAVHRYETGWDRFEVATLRRIAMALGAQLEVRLVAGESPPDGKPSAGSLVDTLEPLFWDKRLVADDLESHPVWVLSRVLAFGNADQVRAARAFFGDGAIRDAINRRGMDARTRRYWNLVVEHTCNDVSARPQASSR